PFRRPPTFAQDTAKRGISDIIMLGDLEGMREETGCVPPVTNLVIADQGADEDQRDGNAAEQGGGSPQAHEQGASSPDQGDQQSEQGQVHEPIGDGLAPGLDNPNGGDKDAEEPKPTDGYCGQAPEEPEREAGDGKEQEEAEDDLSGGPIARMRVKHG